MWISRDFVSTVGVGEAVIRNYAAMQGGEDAGGAELDLQLGPVRKRGELYPL